MIGLEKNRPRYHPSMISNEQKIIGKGIAFRFSPESLNLFSQAKG
jgi:hypothetical protein